MSAGDSGWSEDVIGSVRRFFGTCATLAAVALAVDGGTAAAADGRSAGVPYQTIIARMHAHQLVERGQTPDAGDRLSRGVRRVVAGVRETYRDTVPEPARVTLRNVLGNLEQPATALNSLLAVDVPNALIAVQRFAINSTLGLGGARDRATDMGVVSRRETLGQAICSYGLDGPYLVLPILGPTTGVETAGRVGGIVIGYSLFGQYYVAYRLVERAVSVLDADLAPAAPAETQEATYETQRGVWLANRATTCRIAGLARRQAIGAEGRP